MRRSRVDGESVRYGVLEEIEQQLGVCLRLRVCFKLGDKTEENLCAAVP